MQVVVFKISDELFAVETSKVQSITDMTEVTKVPKAPEHIRGLINLRGSIIPLLDINLLLNISKSSKVQSNIIILNVDDEQVGISVDEVEEVLEIDEKLIQRLENEKYQSYVKGIVNFDDKLVTLVDINKILKI
ncbi:chemotaxis protein CheW [Clostridium folliculivorans]|uniref:Chemotaxis protein CheW n=1 Tax=Clostridium folliculivorans TaxID=2886038 RepID=A0A9W5XYX3_9CLOT|nr:chemotaxis protein CheW [Clostridium folliculivorans]GKU23548.1 chemotaxis protein CheW [Clostridium folliculivorans]GKU29664.1 chemotaxis protein CheW [Clostridium folliculivorans]